MRQNTSLKERTTVLKNELQTMLDKAISDALRLGAQTENKQGTRSYRERVERLLYARSGLDILISALCEELSEATDTELETSMAYEKTDAKVVRLFPQGDALGIPHKRADIEALLTKNRLAAKRIDRALETLSNDPYYPLLELKYTKRLSEEKIAEALCCDPSTVRRNKNRMLESLAVIFFGIDAV